MIYQEVKPVPESTAAVQPGYEKAIEKLTGMHGEIINENDGFINSISGLNRKISRQELFEGEQQGIRLRLTRVINKPSFKYMVQSSSVITVQKN